MGKIITLRPGNGAPSFFVTLSRAEHHWPDIIRLVKQRMTIAGQDPSIAIWITKVDTLLNQYSIVVQEFFQARVKHGCVQLGKDVFDIEHYPV
jgi:hypothetical protein